MGVKKRNSENIKWKVFIMIKYGEKRMMSPKECPLTVDKDIYFKTPSIASLITG